MQAHLILVVRPEPGAAATAERARRLGFEVSVAPLFRIEPLAWTPPDPSAFDALMLTSANAVRHAGPALTRYAGLPAWTVGIATAAAARAAGLAVAHVGSADASALLDEMAGAHIARPLHLAGREATDADHPIVEATRLAVYAADAIDMLPPAAVTALDAGAVTLLHSPRAAALFARLLDRPRARVAIAALSQAVADAAGPGWAAVAIAASPDDRALLAAAAGLCDGRGDAGEGQA